MEMRRSPFARILVPIDGSELSGQAIPYAERLRKPDSMLYLLTVAPHPEEIRSAWGGVVATEADVEEMTDLEAAQHLERALTLLPVRDRVETEIVHGDPADQILQTALRHSVDLIIMASHGRGVIGRLTFGSVADRVSRESLVPAMIICPNPERPTDPDIKRVVVPFDGSDLSAQALPVAISFARQLSIPLHLVRVISPATALYPSIALGAPVSDESYQHVLNDEQRVAEQQLGAHAMALLDAGVKATHQIMVGPTVEGIEQVLTTGDIVVISSHGRSGVRRWLLGSVAERLIRDGLVPVVLVPASEREKVTAFGLSAELEPAVAPV